MHAHISDAAPDPPFQPHTPTTAAQPSILRLKAVFKRPQAGFAQPRRPSLAELAKTRQQARREKATPKPAAVKPQPAEPAEAAQEKEGEEELVVEMEVDPKKIKGRKPRTASRVKKSGSKFAAKKQKGVKK